MSQDTRTHLVKLEINHNINMTVDFDWFVQGLCRLTTFKLHHAFVYTARPRKYATGSRSVVICRDLSICRLDILLCYVKLFTHYKLQLNGLVKNPVARRATCQWPPLNSRYRYHLPHKSFSRPESGRKISTDILVLWWFWSCHSGNLCRDILLSGWNFLQSW